MKFEDYSSRAVQLCVSLIRDQALARKWISGPSKSRRILIHFTGMESCSHTNEKGGFIRDFTFRNLPPLETLRFRRLGIWETVTRESGFVPIFRQLLI